MPKGQSPSKRMDARRSLLNERVDRQSGIRLPKMSYEKDASPVKKLVGKTINTLSDARAKQMQRQGGKDYQDDVRQLRKIDRNRDLTSDYTSGAKGKSSGDTPVYAKGGKVKAQSSGNGFKGTF
jgi:hypothetical protein